MAKDKYRQKNGKLLLLIITCYKNKNKLSSFNIDLINTPIYVIFKSLVLFISYHLSYYHFRFSYLLLLVYMKVINKRTIFESVFDKNDKILFEDISFIADRCFTKFHVVGKSCNKMANSICGLGFRKHITNSAHNSTPHIFFLYPYYFHSKIPTLMIKMPIEIISLTSIFFISYDNIKNIIKIKIMINITSIIIFLIIKLKNDNLENYEGLVRDQYDYNKNDTIERN